MRFALVCFDGMEELDLVGPWEVLRMWQLQWPDDGADVFTVSLDGPTVTCAKGMQIVADILLDDFVGADVVVYPGGHGTRRHIADERIGSWLRELKSAGTLMTSVCTGSLVFAGAGILENRPATTIGPSWGPSPNSTPQSRFDPTTVSSTRVK